MNSADLSLRSLDEGRKLNRAHVLHSGLLQRMERRVRATAQFHFDTPQLAAGSFIHIKITMYHIKINLYHSSVKYANHYIIRASHLEIN